MAGGEIMDMETVLAGLAEAARIAGGYVPAEAALADAPLINDWILGVSSGHGVHLVGIVTDHPKLGSGLKRTSMVLALDEEAGWARTISRYYRLGPRRMPEPKEPDPEP